MPQTGKGKTRWLTPSQSLVIWIWSKRQGAGAPSGRKSPKKEPQTWQWRAGGCGEDQFPHQSFDWNHKTVTEWARPWPLADMTGVEPVKVLRPPRAPRWPRRRVWRPSQRHELAATLLPQPPELHSLQPLNVETFPRGLISPRVARVNQAQGLIDRCYRGWISLLQPIWAFSSDCGDYRSSCYLLRLQPASTRRTGCRICGSLISSIFKQPTIKEPLAYSG